jgi:hypothetical protein
MYRRLAYIMTAFVISTSIALANDPIVTESTTTTKSETTVNSPPPSAISPSINSMNNDLCTVGVSGAVQTQILGISGGQTVRDMNCERIKLAKNLFDMGMRVAAVSTLCQDSRVWSAMMDAGTPCPIDGQIGEGARNIWEENPDRIPMPDKERNSSIQTTTGFLLGIGAAALLFLVF